LYHIYNCIKIWFDNCKTGKLTADIYESIGTGGSIAELKCNNCESFYAVCRKCSLLGEEDQEFIDFYGERVFEEEPEEESQIVLCQFIGYVDYYTIDGNFDYEDVLPRSISKKDEKYVSNEYGKYFKSVEKENRRWTSYEHESFSGPDGGFPYFYKCYECNFIYCENDK